MPYSNMLVKSHGLDYPSTMMWMMLSLGMLLVLYIVIWPTEEKLLFAAVSPYFLMQFTDDVFGIQLSGLASGGSSSPLQIGICVISTGAVLLLAFLVYKPVEGVGLSFSNTGILLFAWIGLISLQSISVYLDPTKWVPLASLLCFTITSSVLVFFGGDLQRIVKVLVYWGLIGTAIIFIGILTQKNWTASDKNFTDSLYEKSTYFSPLSGILGLPTRNNFYFNSGPQILGITFALLFCVALALRSSFLKWISIVSFLCVGSLSGSRTFYVVAAVVVLLKIVFARSKFIDLDLTKIVCSLSLISAGAYYILSTNSANAGLKTLNGRSIIWSLVSNHWNDTSLLGHGPGSLAAFARNAYTFFPFVHAHNSYLQLLWDFGVLGICFAIIISILAVYSFDLRNFQNFTLVGVALFVIQTEITLEASVMNPLAIFWVVISLQFLHKVRFYKRIGSE